MLTALLMTAAFAALNRARGSKLFGTSGSTTASRLVATLGMAAATVSAADGGRGLLLWAWVSLYLWSVPGWGKYAGAATGGPVDPAEREFAPVDRLMARLPVRDTRLWGAVAMGLRMSLAAPCVLGVAHLTGGSPWPALLTPLMGLAYLPCGLAFGPRGWEAGEYCAGAVLGLLIVNAIP